MDKTTIIKDSRCSECNTFLDAMASLEGNIPKPGDIAICIKCGNMAEYVEGGTLITVTKETIVELKKDKESWDEIVKYQKAITIMHGNQA